MCESVNTATTGKAGPTSDAPLNSHNVETRFSGGFVDAVLLIAAWTVFLFAVQEYTTGSNYPLPWVKAVGSRTIRLLLDLLACGTAVLLLTGKVGSARGWHLHVALIGGSLALSVMVVYYEYFDRALSWTTITYHYSEGWAVFGFATQLLRRPSIALIAGATVILVLLARRVNRTLPPFRKRANFAALCGIAYLLLALLSTQYIDKIKKLKTFATVDRLAMTNGYLLTWYGEWRYLNADALLVRAMEAARVKQDRLTPLEPVLSVGDKVTIIQVESLDYDVVGLEVGGQHVMPFLRDLFDRSMRYRITAIHKSGSCDSDFAMLMNLNPAGDVTPYVVTGFDWSPSLAALAAQGGYRSVFLHGNDHNFFNRGPVVNQMGFDQVLFRAELESQFKMTSKHWGVSDEDVFAVSSAMLNEDAGRALHFLITLTSHGPYHFLDPEDCELFPTPSSAREHYLNSMRYVDRQLQTYIGSLPDDTLVVLYGDHSSHVDYGQEPVIKGVEHVPFLIYRVGTDSTGLSGDWAQKQKTRDQDISISGELTTLDAAGYVWSFLRAAAINRRNRRPN